MTEDGVLKSQSTVFQVQFRQARVRKEQMNCFCNPTDLQKLIIGVSYIYRN
jgi:hypothetical protein